MKNFPFTYKLDNGKEVKLWYSRSVAVGLFLFSKDKNGKWYVLACQRGSGAESEIGKWNCPGGFIDFDESIYKAAVRECFEETGIIEYVENIHIAGIQSNFFESNRQTISIRFYCVSEKDVEELNTKISFLHNEKNECKCIKFIPLDEIFNYEWAFNHSACIIDIFHHYIKKQRIIDRIKLAFRIICGLEPARGEDHLEFK